MSVAVPVFLWQICFCKYSILISNLPFGVFLPCRKTVSCGCNNYVVKIKNNEQIINRKNTEMYSYAVISYLAKNSPELPLLCCESIQFVVPGISAIVGFS